MKYLLILILMVSVCFSADVVMLVGGTGTQAAPASYPGLVKTTSWDSGDVVDFCGTNGAAISADDADGTVFTVDTNGTTVYYLGVADTTGITTDMYVFIYDVSAGSNAAGYYEITSIDTNSKVYIDLTALDGSSTMATSDSAVSYTIGGAMTQSSSGYTAAGTALEFASDLVGLYLDIGTNSVEMLTNRSETATAGTDADADASVLGYLKYTGCVYDDSVANNNFVPAVKESEMPVITTTGISNGCKFTGQMIMLQGIKVVGGYYAAALISSGQGAFVINCIGINDQDSNGCQINYGTVLGGRYTSKEAAGIYLITADAYGAYASGETGIKAQATTRGANVHNCIISAQAGTTPADGLLIDGGSSILVRCGFTNNSIEGFPNSIRLSSMPDLTDTGNIYIVNNAMWGDDSGSSYGIKNDENATKKSGVYMRANAIGNTNTDYDGFLSPFIVDEVALSVNPFVNAGTSFALASDFILNTTAGGGLSCINSGWPRDVDLDGVEENFTAIGALQSDSVTLESGRRSSWTYW